MQVHLRYLLRGRAYDQIRNSVCYPKLNVKICATHSGITVGEDGATHQMIEDISLMRTLPNMTVLSTSDDTQTKWAVEEISKINGPVFLRLARLATPIIYDENQKFEIGKMIQIGEGTDASIFATGVTVAEAIKAKEELEKQGINIRVIDVHTIKPIDEEMIIKCAKETKKLISVGDLELDLDKFEVKVRGEVIDLTLREFEVLKFLASEPGQVVTRETLLEKVWGYEYYGDIRTVDVTVRRIREKIEKDTSNPKILITKRGVGYYIATDY